MTSTYTWTATTGTWTDPANWDDLTSPGAGTAPGAGDVATVKSPGAFYLIYGPANAATLTTAGSIAFADTSDLGFWTQTDYGPVDILPGAVVSADTATLTAEVQIAGAGAALLVAGTLTDNSSIALFDGASLRAQNLAGSGNISLDSTATAEIGGGSIATAGTLAIDAGTSITSNGAFYAPVLDQGTIVVSGFRDFYGAVTGTGEILIEGTLADVQLDASVAAGITIAFAPGESGVLSLPSLATDSVDATITGFAAGDGFVATLPGITAATYTATGADLGTLALLANGATVETLTLAGTYTSDEFVVITDGRGDGAADVVLAADAVTTPAEAVTNPGSDAYRWNVTAGGEWDTAANWTDTTTGLAATTAPGATNVVTLTNTGTTQVPILNGNGNAATLVESGIVALNGTFDVGLLSVGVSSPYTPGTLDLLAGSTLAAGTADINDTMLIGAGADLIVGGTLSVGDSNFFGVLSASDGGRVVAGGLTFSYGTVTTDANSAIEIGDAGNAVLGALNIDAGITFDDSFGVIDTALVNNGLVAVPGNYYRNQTVFAGAISGAGTVQLGDYADAVLQGSVAPAQKIDFVGTEATLDVTAGSAVDAPIAGLVVTDELLAAPTVVGARFVPASANSGLLDLTDANGNVVETLTVSGSMSGNTFLVLPDPFSRATVTATNTPAGGTYVVLAAGTLQSGPAPTPSAGTQAGQSFTWNALGGAWGTAANWGDVSTAPGSLDTVALENGDGYYSVISGAGNAAAVSETGGDALSGNFDFGTLTIQSLATAYGWLDVAAGATLHVGTATVTSGTLEAVGAGATLDVAGTLTLGAAGSTSETASLYVADGASARIAGLTLATSTAALQAADIGVDATSTLEIGTAGGAAAGVLTVDAGQSIGGGVAVLRIDGNVTNNGTIAADIDGTTIDGTVGGSGTLAIGSFDDLTVIGGIAAGQTVAFTGTSGALLLTTGPLPEEAGPNNAPAANPFAGTIAGFSSNTIINFDGVVNQASYTATGADLGTLALGDDGTVVATLTLSGDYADSVFLADAPATSTSNDGLSEILLAAACFAEGTRLDTPGGPVAIERLCVGDTMLTASGTAPVQWIGRRRTDCRQHPRPQDVWPVRVAAHAFGPGQPRRPLYLSPDHAVFVEGVLIPVRYLIDGELIAQVPVNSVTYWHVELPRHDIVLSEGLPSESFLDTGNRAAFDNGGTVVQAHPDFSRRLWDGDACAPLVVAGPLLERVRAGLRRVAVRAA